ncbi:MAG: hypothetical protein INQ03_19820 [Candidatus Heimdallarchaeota archaeon]|nr:hypothetical protein [Candidatus Heimdallarchaeota archaeon]
MDLSLPLDWHNDGTPIFNRGDIIRPSRPTEPSIGITYDNLMLPEHRHLRPELRFNLHVIPPGNTTTDQASSIYLGKSYPDSKRGFIFGRIIQALDPTCRVILQRWERTGIVTDFVQLICQPLHLAMVPPTYESVLINAAVDAPARFFEIQAWEEARNIDTIKSLGGPGYILKKDGGLIPNSNYDELPIPRIHPGLDGFKFMSRRSLYEMLTHYPKGFDFIDPPYDEFFAGSV